MAEEKGRRNLTVLGSETEFDGEMEFRDSLVITGKFRGTIEAAGDLVVESGASCECGLIKASSVEICGSVSGAVEASERVELCSGSVVKGDITAPRVRIADDVEYEGSVSMVDSTPDVNLFSVASDEYRSAFVLKSNMPR